MHGAGHQTRPVVIETIGPGCMEECGLYNERFAYRPTRGRVLVSRPLMHKLLLAFYCIIKAHHEDYSLSAPAPLVRRTSATSIVTHREHHHRGCN